MRRWKTLILALICSANTLAQSQLTWQEFAEQFFYVENEAENEEQRQNLYDLLYDIHQNPIELNGATLEQLLQLPFLTEEQARDIVFYRDFHKPIRSLGELMFIRSIGFTERQYLSLFCYADSTQTPTDSLSFKRLIRYIHHQAILKTEIPFYTKAGHKSYSDSILERYPNRRYVGDRYYGSLRYNLSSLDHLHIGLQAEKDHGERGLDYLSGFFHLRNIKLGRQVVLKDAILGNFKTSFGMGLAISNGLSLGKTTSLNRNLSIDRGFTHHSSMSEYGYFTGAAISVKYKFVTLSAYAAYNPVDATLLNDSTGFSSLKTDGLHRTPLERSKHHNTRALNIGGNLHFDIRNLQLSLTAVHTHFNRTLSPQWNTKSTFYKKYYAAGTDFQNYSLNYFWYYRKIRFAGETAVSRASGIDQPQVGFATLNTLRYTPSSTNTLTLIYRQYDKKYTTINGNAFSENSLPQNETGIYLGWQTNMVPALDINTYVDLMYFPWLRYQVGNRSFGIDASTDMSWKINSKASLSFRYRIKSKQKDFKYSSLGGQYAESDKTVLQYNTRQTFRLQYTHTLSSHWHIQTTANATLLKFSINPMEHGFSIGQLVRWTGRNKNLNITLAATYFNTDSYSTATYAYEPSLLYSYGISTYFYHGIRSTLLANIPIVKWASIGIKASVTAYIDHSSIGTGTETIQQSHKEDLEVQLKIKL